MVDRQPTSHERMAGQSWDASYTGDEPAPWDIERAQPVVERLAAAGAFTDPVLDAGCGSGENALHLAARGFSVLGFDVAETALAGARAKADARGIAAEFVVADALQLEQLGRAFATVLDCGLFHAFDNEERSRYASSLAAATESGGTVYVLCFADYGENQGPHPVAQAELRQAFAASSGWQIVSIEADRVLTRFHGDVGAPAWLATVRRL
jgi:SAM-dependent methyltransferase